MANVPKARGSIFEFCFEPPRLLYRGWQNNLVSCFWFTTAHAKIPFRVTQRSGKRKAG